MQHPESDGFVSGKEALRSWWKDAFERLPSLNYKVKSLTANGDRVFMDIPERLLVKLTCKWQKSQTLKKIK
jgi:predicted SnoaL-like aldol condensation-catalyzing enzyme